MKDPKKKGSYGYVVSSSANRYVTALQKAGHHATAIHDPNENHSSLVEGFGETSDQITQAVKEFLKSRNYVKFIYIE